MPNLNKETVLSYFLAFVVFWFGFNEVLNPESWAAFVPAFLGSGSLATNLVIFHGIMLFAVGAALVFNFHRKIAATVLCLMLADIILTLWFTEGLSEIVVRDIGLFGASLALALKN